MRALRRPGWPRSYDAQPFPCPVDPLLPARRGPAPGGWRTGTRKMRRPGDRKASGRGVSISALHVRAPKPAESHCPVSAALGPQGPARVQHEVGGPAGTGRGDARQKAAGRRRGRVRPRTPTRTRPAGGAERRMATLAPAWRCCPLLLLPTAERPALPSRRPAAEGANAGGHPSPRRLPSPRPYNPPRRPEPALPPRPRPPGRTRLSSRVRPTRTKGLRGEARASARRFPGLRRHQVSSTGTWRKGPGRVWAPSAGPESIAAGAWARGFEAGSW